VRETAGGYAVYIKKVEPDFTLVFSYSQDKKWLILMIDGEA
jgi:hypothetical protein